MRRHVFSGLCALLLALLCVFSFAGAEELPYFRQMAMGAFSVPLASPESYPEICLSAAPVSDAFSEKPSAAAGRFVVFPRPEDTCVYEFSPLRAACWVENANFEYYLASTKTTADFLKEAQKNNIVLQDEATGAAAYIEPKGYKAYGFIPVPELGDGYGVVVDLFMQRISKLPGSEIRDTLTTTITAEVNRIRGSLRVETMSPWWSFRKFSGFKLLCNDADSYMLRFDFPTARTLGLAENPESGFAIHTLDGTFNSVEGCYMIAPGVYVLCRISMSTSLPTDLDARYATKEIAEYTDTDGTKWLVSKSSLMNTPGVYDRLYFARVIPTPDFDNQAMNDRTFYLSFYAAGYGIDWNDSIVNLIIEAVGHSYAIMDGNSDPYVPSGSPEAEPAAPAPAEEPAGQVPEVETPAAEEPAGQVPEAETPAAEESGWTCESCGHAGNEGNFCPNCGAARPVPAEWTCGSCGHAGNEGNFCPNCGAARPQ